MTKELLQFFEGKKILILGFGKEGKSTYRLLKDLIPPTNISIADRMPEATGDFEDSIAEGVKVYTGESYLDEATGYDMLIKSPGIPKNVLEKKVDASRITSQTNLFLRFFGKQIIGVTGTKGKSTTSSLIRHILHGFDHNAILAGNIGMPPFDYIHQINESTHIVYELSSHQLDDVFYSPHIAVMLNLYEEHLDHYGSFENYRNAKSNIFRFQKDEDFLVINLDDNHLKSLQEGNGKSSIIGYSENTSAQSTVFSLGSGMIRTRSPFAEHEFDFSQRSSLPGDHNLRNIMSAVAVSLLLNVPRGFIENGIQTFTGLEHRLEFVGTFKGIHFYNDSIATVPEATIEAVKTLKDTDTLILGGKDRGINYSSLITFLPGSPVRNFICMGEAGLRIAEGLQNHLKPDQRIHIIDEFSEIRNLIITYTKPGKICLLSPAAASYDWFLNFEERGKVFKKIAENL